MIDPRVTRLRQIILDYFKDPFRAELWFKTKHAHLRGLTPEELIRRGEVKTLVQFVSDNLQGY